MATPFLGELRVFSFNFAPKGWASCNGQSLSIQQNQALFALLGTMYGGNGTTNFALPDLRSRTPLHIGNGALQGQPFGQESHALTVGEMPAHTHALNAQTAAASVSAPLGNILAAGSTPLYDSALSSPVALANATVTGAGGNQAHENRQPYLTLNICIALQGIFPSRN